MIRTLQPDSTHSLPTGLSQRVYDRLRSMVLRLEIDPGARIAIDLVARTLGVSQTPVREALSRLEADGLVTRVPNSGYCAARALSKEQVAELFELRLLVEPQAARKAALNMSDAEIARFAELGEQARVVLGHGGPVPYAAFAELDSAFHHLIAVGSGNVMMCDLLERMQTHFHLFRRTLDTRLSVDALDEHDRIVAALSARDPDAAEQAMRDHIRISGERMHHFFERRAAA